MKTEEVEPKLTVDSGECREACSPGEWNVLKDGRTDECGAANASKGGRRRNVRRGFACGWDLGSLSSRPRKCGWQKHCAQPSSTEMSCLPGFRLIANALLRLSLLITSSFHVERWTISFSAFDDNRRKAPISFEAQRRISFVRSLPSRVHYFIVFLSF